MKTLKVYFDFACPYCYIGLTVLMELLPDYPQLTVEWVPCEAHPRPEECAHYSDLAAEAFLYVRGHKGNQTAYIKGVYEALFKKGIAVDNKEMLISLSDLAGIAPASLKASLTRRDYRQDVMYNNNEIWEVQSAEAVPAYYCRNKSLVSKENHFISGDLMREFLASL